MNLTSQFASRLRNLFLTTKDSCVRFHAQVFPVPPHIWHTTWPYTGIGIKHGIQGLNGSLIIPSPSRYEARLVHYASELKDLEA